MRTSVHPHPRNFGVALCRFMHKLYKITLSPFIGQQCRFEPSCSDYALEAVERRGLVIGFWLALMRICRCNPLCRGGHDPVPTGKGVRGNYRC